jgi:hypothetical protein
VTHAPPSAGLGAVGRIVLVELNEVTHGVIQDLTTTGMLPNFARLDRTWARYTTTSEQRQEWLEPWIQWPTVHTGKSFRDHGLFKLGDCGGLQHRQIWERLWDQGIESCVVGSMNASRGSMAGGIFIPDWWGASRDVYPPELLPLWKMLSSLTQGHATSGLSARDIVTLLRITLRSGLPASAYSDLAWQAFRHLVSPHSRWRSAGALDLLVFRLFSALWKRGRFGFGSVFLNAVAHYQHHYWRRYDPEPFAAKVTYPDIAVGDDPVRWGYRLYDRILGQVIRLADAPDTLVIVASALSQGPYTQAEEIGGEHHYRLIDLGAFLRAIGLEPSDGSALMSRDFRLQCRDEAGQRRARQTLESLTVAGESLFTVTDLSDHALAANTRVARQLADDAWIADAGGRPIAPFASTFRCTAIKSGAHDGTGTVWFSHPVAPLLQSAGSTIWLGELFEVIVRSLLPLRVVRGSGTGSAAQASSSYP